MSSSASWSKSSVGKESRRTMASLSSHSSCSDSDLLVQTLVQTAESNLLSSCKTGSCDSSPARSGRRGRWFKSSRPDSKLKQLVSLNCGELFLVEEQGFALFSRLVSSVQSILRISTHWSSDFRNILCASRLESSNPVATSKRLGR